MPDNDRPLPPELTDPANWKLADLRQFNEGRAAYLAAVGEQCGVPRMNAFVHALEIVDGLDVHLAIRAVGASELCRQMITWANEHSECTARRVDSRRSAPRSVHHRGIACNRGAPRQARTWLVEIVNGQVHETTPWRAGIVADAALCMNELVIAALTAGCKALALSVAISPDLLRTSVLGLAGGPSDPFDLNMPTLRAQVMSFRIVNALADDWGADSVAPGRELWAEFALHTSGRCAGGVENEFAGTTP